MGEARITSVDFSNFKALKNFSLSIQGLNILVGANNCGKSTILSAFRALSVGLRKARAKSPEIVYGPSGQCYGYLLSKESLPISVENVHTEYSEDDTKITFRLSNGNKLILYFSENGQCLLIPETKSKQIRTPSQFKSQYPISICCVPVLGPVEYNETLRGKDTIARDLETHRASRHFRNYWHYFPDNFQRFAEMVANSWPGMEVELPELTDGALDVYLSMYCKENRMTRELFWAGFGFQVWCQLLTHISRSKNDDLIIIDEPEIYLHPDVQRQLVYILRNLNSDVLIATHSSEIISDADPAEVITIDKNNRSGKRLRDYDEIQFVLNAIGSIQNITLTKLAKNRRVLFIEGKYDYGLIRKFARKTGNHKVYIGSGISPLESHGFSSWEEIRHIANGIEKTLNYRIPIAAVFDRDYYCDEEIDFIENKLKSSLEFSHFHGAKEIENYLLNINAIEKACNISIKERVERNPSLTESQHVNVKDKILEICEKYKFIVQSQFMAKRLSFIRNNNKTKDDDATINLKSMTIFNEKWEDINKRMLIVPGKDVIKEFRSYLQNTYGINVTDTKIIDQIDRSEIPENLVALIKKIEIFQDTTIKQFKK